jgi:hypothetical protein
MTVTIKPMPLAELMQLCLQAWEDGVPYPYLWRDRRGRRLAMKRDASVKSTVLWPICPISGLADRGAAMTARP